IAAGSRFLQPWIEPEISSNNYVLKSEDFSDMKYKEISTKTQQFNPSSRNAGKTKEDKYGLDSCK
ncbi:homeobox protein Hox-C9-like, partial [Clarias magur]